jgi:hypothetical protein
LVAILLDVVLVFAAGGVGKKKKIEISRNLALGKAKYLSGEAIATTFSAVHSGPRLVWQPVQQGSSP